MIQKREKCDYCGNPMESKTAKKRFCSEKCRVYANREKKARNTPAVVEVSTLKYEPIQGPSAENKQTQTPVMPVKLPGEDSLIYAGRKNEWKKKYNQ